MMGSTVPQVVRSVRFLIVIREVRKEVRASTQKYSLSNGQLGEPLDSLMYLDTGFHSPPLCCQSLPLRERDVRPCIRDDSVRPTRRTRYPSKRTAHIIMQEYGEHWLSEAMLQRRRRGRLYEADWGSSASFLQFGPHSSVMHICSYTTG